MKFDFQIVQDFWFYIVEGIIPILILSGFSAFFGIILGLSSVFLRKINKIFHFIVVAYIDFFRGTPVYVQLYFAYFGIPSLIPGVVTDPWITAIIVFSLNSGAYLSEIMRAGIDAINKGQIEAAKALGVGSKDIAFDIIIPQAFRNILPAVMNEFITLTKETAIVGFMGLQDMMYRVSVVKNGTFSTVEALVVVLIAYYLLNKALSLVGKQIERKLQYD